MTARPVAPGGPPLSVQAKVSDAEWRQRVDLAACYRLVDLYDMTDMISNHISARAPGTEDHFLINPYGLHYGEITASSLVKIDIDGNIVFNATEYGINPAGYVIHSAIHRALPRVDCVIHTHTVAGMAVSAQRRGLLPLVQTSMRFARIAYHDYEGVAVRLEEQARLVADLGDHEAMILRNHGLITVGESIPEAFNTMFRLERSCQVQLAALAGQAEVVTPPDDVVMDSYRMFHPKLQPSTRRRYGILEWPALLRKLDRIDPSFRE